MNHTQSEEPTKEELRLQRSLLVLQQDVANLKNGIADAQSSWWRRGWTITSLAAVVASTLPLATCINGYYTTKRDPGGEQSARLQLQQLHLQYLSRIDQPETRLRTLRFLCHMSTDLSLKAWAFREESISLTSDILPLTNELAEVEKKAQFLVQDSDSVSRLQARALALKNQLSTLGYSPIGSGCAGAFAPSNDGV